MRDIKSKRITSGSFFLFFLFCIIVINPVFVYCKTKDSSVIFFAMDSTLPQKKVFKKNCGFSLQKSIKITIENHSDIELQNEIIKNDKIKIQQEQGLFDSRFEAEISHNHDESAVFTRDLITDYMDDERKTDETKFQIAFKKKFRSGIVVTPALQITRTDTTVFEIDPGQKKIYDAPTNQAKVDLLVTVPLLKGYGKKVNTANEMVAKKQVDVRVYELHHMISQKILNTILAYWQYLSSNKRLIQIIDSEKRAQVIVKETKTYIKAGNRPESDLKQTLANLSDKRIQRITAEQDLFAQKQNLGITMGFDFMQSKNIQIPSDSFLQIDKKIVDEICSNTSQIVKKALNNRSDYLQLIEQEWQKKLLVKAAKNNSLPQLDLNMDVGYTGLDEGDGVGYAGSAFTNNIKGYNYAVSLNYNLFLENSTAKSILFQKKSELKQIEIIKQGLRKNISSNILIAVDRLKNSLKSLLAAEESVTYYKSTLNNEEKKFKIGTATLFDLIQIEENLTNSTLTFIAAKLNYASAMAQLKYETGSIVRKKGNSFSVKLFQTAIDF